MKVVNVLGETCTARWEPFGGKLVLRAEVSPGVSIYAYLGYVSRKNDGRYLWRFSKGGRLFNPPGVPAGENPWRTEGVTATEDEAKRTIEGIWTRPVSG